MATDIYAGIDSNILRNYKTIDDSIIIHGDYNCRNLSKRIIDIIIELNPRLESITLSEIYIIDSFAFQNLNKAISEEITIDFGENITAIRNFAFAGCTKIKSILLPYTLTDDGFGQYIFKDCINLETVYYDSTSRFTMIPEGTFLNSGLKKICPKLNTAYCSIEPPINRICRRAFEGTNLNEQIYLNVKTIESFAFRNCDTIKYISIKCNTMKEEDQSKYMLNHSYNQEMIAVSKRQFRYKHIKVEENNDSAKIKLGEDFKYCPDSSHYMIYHNNCLIPTSYIVVRTEYLTPVGKENQPTLYLNIPISIGDTLDVFYLPNPLEPVTHLVENVEVSVNKNGELIRSIPESGYIRFTSPLYGKSSRHSLFVFVNGEKIPFDELEDISDTILKIMTDKTTGKRIDIYSHIDEVFNTIVYSKDGLSHELESNWFGPGSKSSYSKIDQIDLANLDSYKTSSLLDEMLNHSPDKKLDTLFLNNARLDYQEDARDYNFKSKKQLLQSILQDYQIDNDEWINNLK
ncbi:MAG: leucine-rich repeat domain-containing protein [Succinivibrionaceae bacterium]